MINVIETNNGDSLAESILLKNVKIPFMGDLVEGSIYIENGIIKSVSKVASEAKIVINGEGLPVVPGGIDIHAHIYDPEYTSHEDWESGSLAALYGGITTVVDMPLRVFVDNPFVLEAKIIEAKKNSYVNYGITGGFLNEKNYEFMESLVDKGVKTFKMFTCKPFKVEDRAIPKIMEKARMLKVLLIIHAEDEEIVNYLEEKYRVFNDILSYHLSRSGLAEALAIMKVGYMALETNAQIHIAHLSSKEGVEAVKFLKNKGAKITAETCPHYLYFTREDSTRYGAYLKMTPTLKGVEDRDALWRALRSGLVDIYASDNAPSPREFKERDVWSAWGGIPNLEIMGPLLYTYGVKAERIDLETYIKVFSENPARLLGLYPLMGNIVPGSIADLVVIDTRTSRRISASNHHHKVDWTPWENIELYGCPKYAFVNGNLMIEKGELVGKPGLGIYIGNLFKENNKSTRSLRSF